jgi:O-antigen/teichoic acid export membrane protein
MRPRAARSDSFMRPSGLRDFALNLGGNAIPLVAALVAVPVIAAYAGTDRLGLLALIWTLIGYLGLLDLGLGRVLTRRFALAEGEAQLRGEVALLRLLLVRAPAIVGAVGVAAAALFAATFDGPADAALAAEVRVAAWIVAVALPAVVATGLVRGALEGRQLFLHSNALKSLLGALTFLAPAAIALAAPSLVAMAAGIAAVRLLGFAAHAVVGAALLPRPEAAPGGARFALLLREGGWITLTNVVGPLMVTFDRFAVGALVSLAAIAHYALPQEAALRLLLVPAALATTLYPALARGQGARSDLGRRGVDAALSLGLPTAIAFLLLAEPALALWMGAEFARAGAPVAAVLAVGLLANSVAQIPFAWIQARGRPDLTAALHVAELPVYAAALWWLTSRYGIAGAAWAWSLRAAVDCVLLFALARRLDLLHDAAPILRDVALAIVLASAAAFALVFAAGAARAAALAAVVLAALALSFAWGRRALARA